MRKITLTADGETLTGHLPDFQNWDEVGLAAYAALAGADDVPARCQAVARLTGLPVGPLLDDVALLSVILEAAPWLFDGQHLPPAGEPVPLFKHLGVKYEFVGALQKISAEQMEALLDFLAANKGHALTCAPNLLAVLYRPKGKKQTAEVVRDASTAFATLPMAIAWPALASFMGSSGPRATGILSFFAVRAQVENLLTALETTVRTGGISGTSWRKPLHFLVRAWLRNARKTLST